MIDAASPQDDKRQALVVADDELQQRLSSLTPREMDVLREVAERKTNREVGTKLHIAAGTVKLHISHALQKLRLKNRRDLFLHLSPVKAELTTITADRTLLAVELLLTQAVTNVGGNLTHREEQVLELIAQHRKPRRGPSSRGQHQPMMLDR